MGKKKATGGGGGGSLTDRTYGPAAGRTHSRAHVPGFSCRPGTVALDTRKVVTAAFEQMRVAIPHAVKHLRRAREALAVALAAEDNAIGIGNNAAHIAFQRLGTPSANNEQMDKETELQVGQLALKSVTHVQAQLHVLCTGDKFAAAQLGKLCKTMTREELDALCELLDRLENFSFSDFVRSMHASATAADSTSRAAKRPARVLAAAYGALTARESEEASRRRRQALMAAATHQGHGGARERLAKNEEARTAATENNAQAQADPGTRRERRGSIVARLERKYRSASMARETSPHRREEGEKHSALWAPWNAARVVDSLLFIDRAKYDEQARQRQLDHERRKKEALGTMMLPVPNSPTGDSSEPSEEAGGSKWKGALDDIGIGQWAHFKKLRALRAIGATLHIGVDKLKENDEKIQRIQDAMHKGVNNKPYAHLRRQWSTNDGRHDEKDKKIAFDFLADIDNDSCEEYDAWCAPFAAYGRACNRHGVAPSNSIVRQLEKNELRVTGYHLGPSGMKALAEALSETHIGDGASAASTLIRVSDENINSHEEFGEAEWHLDLTRRSGQRTGSRAKQAPKVPNLTDAWRKDVGLPPDTTNLPANDSLAAESSRNGSVSLIERARYMNDTSLLVRNTVQQTEREYEARAKLGAAIADHTDVQEESTHLNPMDRFMKAGYAQGYNLRFDLTHIELVHTKIGPDGCEALVKALLDCDHFPLEVLVLDGNLIGSRGANALTQFFDFVTHAGRVRRGHEGARHHHQRIRRFSVAENNLTDASLSPLIDSMQLLGTLEELDISSNRAAVASARSLGKLLEVQKNHLKSIAARWNSFSTVHAETLMADVGGSDCALQRLDLSWNSLCDEGLAVVAAAAASLSSLRSLKLSNVNASASGVSSARDLLASHVANGVDVDLRENTTLPSSRLSEFASFSSTPAFKRDEPLEPRLESFGGSSKAGTAELA